jgi:hypothetical protein
MDKNPSHITAVNLTSVFNFIFRDTVFILVALVIIIMVWFGAVAIAE